MVSANVVIAGGSSPSGIAAALAFARAGHRVSLVGSSEHRVTTAVAAVRAQLTEQSGAGSVTGQVCNLAEYANTQDLAAGLARDNGPTDVLLHLVGGWRGGDSLLEQSDADFDFLLRQGLGTLRNTSRAFYQDLAASPRGRFIMIGSTIAQTPTGKGANYAAVKAAAEAWTAALAQSFSSSDTQAAAVILAVKGLLDEQARIANPQRRFPGYTHVDALARAAVELLDSPGPQINGQRFILPSWDA